MAQRNIVNQNVTQEDEDEIIDAMFCADPECKFNLRDHEMRLRKVEASVISNNALLESLNNVMTNSNETQKATVESLNELTKAVIRIDGKVDNLGQASLDRKEEISKVENKFSEFKKKFYENEEEMKIDPRKVTKKAVEAWLIKIFVGALAAAGAWGYISQFINSLPK